MPRMEQSIDVYSGIIVATSMLLGTPGNIMILYVLLKHSKFRTMHNAFHASLASVDLITCIVSGPLLLIGLLLSSREMCKYSVSVTTLALAVNTLTLMKICVLRLYVVITLKNTVSKPLIVVLIAFTWGLGAFLAKGYAFNDSGPILAACSGRADSPKDQITTRKATNIFLVPMYACLLVTATVFYWIMSYRTRSQRHKVQPLMPPGVAADRVHYRIQQRYVEIQMRQREIGHLFASRNTFTGQYIQQIAQTGLLLTFTFALAVCPFVIGLLMYRFCTFMSKDALFFCYSLIYISALSNPYVFALRNKRFKEIFEKYLFAS